MIALLDTSILIASRSVDEEPPDLTGFDDLFVSSLTWAELAKGLNTASDLTSYRQRSSRFLSLRSAFGAGVPFDDLCALEYERLLGALASHGKAVRSHTLDRMLAATASVHEMTLVTRDARLRDDFADLVRIEIR